jgi:putative ABC transport system permease protein
VLSLLGYHLKLVGRSLRRDPGYASVMIVSLALSVSLLVTAMAAYRRFSSSSLVRHPGVYRVQPRRNPVQFFYKHGDAGSMAGFINFFVSARVGRAIVASDVPAARTVSFVAALTGGPPDRPAGPLAVRFCDADLFAMFAVGFAHGGPWPRGPDAGGDVAVLSADLNDRLFEGADSVGRAVVVEGRRLTIVGVLAPPATLLRIWGFNPLPDQAELLIPASLTEALRPMPAIMFPPSRPPNWTALVAAPQRFMESWVSLPDEAARAGFADVVARLDPDLELVSADAQIARQLQSPAQYKVFVIFTAVLVFGSVLNAVRLLLAKALARSSELGVYRALGAPRGSLFARQLIEGLAVVVGGATLGVGLGVPAVRVFDVLVPDLPWRLALDPSSAALGWLFCLLVGLLAGLYPAWRVALVPPTRHLGRV